MSARRPQLQKIGRLAMREEGDFWNAYYALPETMDGAILLGSIHMAAVYGLPERKKAFMDFMREFIGDIIEEKTGIRPVWKAPATAPEHERSGNA